MTWIDDNKDAGPWPFEEQPDKPHYNEGNLISNKDNPVWEMDFLNTPVSLDDRITPVHHPWCGYWPKKYVPPSSPSPPSPSPPEYEGKFYCAYPSTGPVYYPAKYSICEINVDLMQVTKTLELPVLPSGYALQPTQMAKSNIYLYAVCRDLDPTANRVSYLATIEIGALALTLIDYYQLPNTTDGGSSVVLSAAKSDLGISMSDGKLIVYNHAYGGPLGNDYAVYRKYLIGSGGIPVQTDEVLFKDVDYKEAGIEASALVTGHLYTFVGMNTEAGRLVKLVESPFTRDSFFDSNSDPAKVGYCYGTCYDVDNNIVYLAINYGDVVGYQQQIIKVDILTMTLIDTLVLSSSSNTIQAICDHPENGFIYASVRDNSSPHLSTLYEIRLSDFTVTRSVVYRGATSACNGLYPDFERGYIYYCGNGSPAVDETEHKFFRFNLTSFSDDLGTYVDVSEVALHWGISTAQAYCAKINSLLPT